MKRIMMIMMAVLSFFLGSCNYAKGNNKGNGDMKILFINGSPNRDGNTSTLAKVLLEGYDYETLALCDYQIDFYGQNSGGDQLDEIIAKMKDADVVVIGSPVYWHNICASVRTVMERFYGYFEDRAFRGKRLFFIYQGAAPSKKMLEDGEYSMSRFAEMYGFSYEGMVTDRNEAKQLREKL